MVANGNVPADPGVQPGPFSPLTVAPLTLCSPGRCVLHFPHLPPGERPRLPPHHGERQLHPAPAAADGLAAAGPHQRRTLWKLHRPGPLHLRFLYVLRRLQHHLLRYSTWRSLGRRGLSVPSPTPPPLPTSGLPSRRRWSAPQPPGGEPQCWGRR